MKIFLLSLCLALTLSASIEAQDKNLAESYYEYSLARIYSMDRQYAEANTHFQKAIDLNPRSSELRVQYALSLWESNHIRDAVNECQKAIDINPNDPSPHYLLGRIYMAYRESNQPNMIDKALVEFEKVIELDPKHAAALDSLGRLYVMKENWAKAADTFGRLTEVNPGYANAYYLRAVSQLKMGKQEEAIKVLERSVESQAAEVEHLKLLGSMYLQVKEPAKAVEVLRMASEADKKDPEIRLELAKALKASRRFNEAIELLSALVKAETELEFEATIELAQLYAMTGRREEAITGFKRVLEMEQAEQFRTGILTNLALVYQDQKRFDEAIETYREVVKLQPDKVENKMRLAYALKDANRGQEAAQITGELLNADPKDEHLLIAHCQMLAATGQVSKAVTTLVEQSEKEKDPERLLLSASQIYVEDKKFDEAEKLIKLGLEKKPDSESLRFQLGAVYERQEEYGNAETTFKQVLAKNPDHAGVLNYLGYMLADRGIRLEEALGYIKKAVDIDPFNGAYLDSLGWAYFKLNQFESAELHLKQAADLTNDDPTIFEHLGDLYRKLERYSEAGNYYEKSMAQAKEAEERKRVQGKLAGVKKLLAQQRQ